MKRLLFITLFICSVFLPTGALAANEKTTDPAEPSISIGAIVPLSGELASQGAIIKVSIEDSIKEANAFLSDTGLHYRLALKIEDSGSDPETARAQAEKLHREGTDIFIVGSSAEVARLKEWSETSGAVIISYNSTAPSLSVPGDGVFRVNPNDIHQAQALATLLEWKNISSLVPVYRNDLYGKELSQLLVKTFKERGGAVMEPVVYDPNTMDFSTVVQQIENRLETIEADRASTGVVLIAFDEATRLFSQADGLEDLRWFGSETVTLNDSILQNEKASSFARAVQLTGVTFGIQESEYYEKVKSAIARRVGDSESIISEAMFAYDIPWMLASVFEKMEEPGDPAELKEKMVELSQYHVGVTGWMVLDEAGDRKYSLYDVWQVQGDEESSNAWTQIGTYRRDPGFAGYIVDLREGASPSLDELATRGDELPMDQEISRVEFAFLLVHALDLNSEEGMGGALAFSDVNQLNQTMKDALDQAAKLGIVSGFQDGTFRPNQTLTRAEMIAMLNRAVGIIADEPFEMLLDDEDAIPHWARADVAIAIEKGIVAPDENNRFNAIQSVTFHEAINATTQAFTLK